MSINLLKPLFVNLTKKEQVTFNLTEFIKLVYKEDYEKMQFWDFYNFYHDLKESDLDNDSLKHLIEKHNLESEKAKELLFSIMINNYENTYINEYLKEFEKQITSKIETDFENVFKINSDIEEFKFDKIQVTEVSFKKNLITFNTSIDNFAKMLINTINDYGMFGFDSVNDFYRSYPANTVKEKVKLLFDHLAWLHEYENIYATVYNIFTFSNKHIDYYGTMGSYEASINNIDSYIKDYGIE